MDEIIERSKSCKAYELLVENLISIKEYIHNFWVKYSLYIMNYKYFLYINSNKIKININIVNDWKERNINLKCN